MKIGCLFFEKGGVMVMYDYLMTPWCSAKNRFRHTTTFTFIGLDAAQLFMHMYREEDG